MIVVYPMLMSSSVSPNVIPGITKAVEKYLILYNTDDILKTVNISLGKVLKTGIEVGQIVAAAGALKMKEGVEIVEEQTQKQLPSSKSTKSGGVGITVKGDSSKSSGGGARPSLDMPRSESLSLEPTWLQITTKKKGMQILGVKVIPFKVKSADTMVQMIMDDKNLKTLSYLTTKYGRAATRVFYRVMRAFKIPIIKDRALTGNPELDVLYGGTQYGKNMFICFNQLEIEQEGAFNKPALVQKLHKLGWTSFIITDDVNKRATFCMKEFGGICSVVPYGFIFSSIGKDHAKVYEDLEELKKTSGPFFSMKTNRKKVMGESRIKNITVSLEELYYGQERPNND